jgi:hypothetical protein
MPSQMPECKLLAFATKYEDAVTDHGLAVA